MNSLASLRYLVALNEHRHFGRAAQACHVTQPALSNALKALEQELGVAIVRRGRSYAGLTAEGERVLATAQRMLHEHALLQQELAGDMPRGRLRIGAVPTAIPVAARFAARLQQRHPGIVPVVLSLASPQLEAGLEDLTLDLALGYTERVRAAGRLRCWPQYDEHYFLVRRGPAAAQALQLGDPCSWTVAAGQALALLTPEMHNRHIVDAAFAAAGTPAQPALETNSVEALTIAVVAGQVAAVLPGALVDTVRALPGLQALPLVEPVVRTPIGFMAPAEGRPARTLLAAVVLLEDAAWLAEARSHAGALVDSGIESTHQAM